MFNEKFDEKKLRQEIARIFGEYGAHVEVFDMIMKENSQLKARLDVAEKLLAESVLNGFDHKEIKK